MNNLGNLVKRTLDMQKKYFDRVVAAPVPAETPAEEVSGAPDIFAPSGTPDAAPDAAADACPLSGKPVFSSDDKPEQPDSVEKEETEPSDPGERGDRT